MFPFILPLVLQTFTKNGNIDSNLLAYKLHTLQRNDRISCRGGEKTFYTGSIHTGRL